MTAPRIANRYAEAFFGLARARGEIEQVRQELASLSYLVSASSGLKQLLARPDLSAEQKLDTLKTALGERFPEEMMALLATLIRHHRGEAVAEVAAAFGEMANDAAGVAVAEVETVSPLSAEQQARLVSALARMTGKTIKLQERRNPGVLAGIRIWVGDRLIDGSAAGRLARLREELLAARG